MQKIFKIVQYSGSALICYPIQYSYKNERITMIVDLEDVNAGDISLVGGKACTLGEMLHYGIPIPSGFVITTNAFHDGMSNALAKKILEAFDGLGVDRVAVRSSAIAEDSQAASWAGQLDSFLNTTREKLIDAIEDCWNSIKSDHATVYANKQRVTEAQLAVAVIVQVMVDSEISGVLFTANPINQSENEYVVESVLGLGELLVQGAVTPETLIIDADTGKVVQRKIHRQNKMLIYQNGENVVVPLPEKNNQQEILKDHQLSTLHKNTKQIADYFGQPQDIEWAFAEDSLYILQSRPITTLKNDAAE